MDWTKECTFTIADLTDEEIENNFSYQLYVIRDRQQEIDRLLENVRSRESLDTSVPREELVKLLHYREKQEYDGYVYEIDSMHEFMEGTFHFYPMTKEEHDAFTKNLKEQYGITHSNSEDSEPIEDFKIDLDEIYDYRFIRELWLGCKQDPNFTFTLDDYIRDFGKDPDVLYEKYKQEVLKYNKKRIFRKEKLLPRGV